ncbi:hypothetical protein EBQ93_01845 [bacterium]|nr:hypothetical protein [bacterium]
MNIFYFVFFLMCASGMHATDSLSIFIHGTGCGFTSHVARNLRYAPRGLVKIDENIKKKKQKPGQYFIVHAKRLAQKNHERFDAESFYTFGWSGNLSFKTRDKASKVLAQELAQTLQEYEDNLPIVRIITFSHGGNIALGLGKYQDLLPKNVKIELILLACPIQAETEQYVGASCFTKIYNIMSHNDVVQRIDPQNIYRVTKDSHSFFSRRTFIQLEEKIRQAQITINGIGFGHVDTCYGETMLRLPFILDALDNQVSPSVYKINFEDADHIAFGPFNYRRWLQRYMVL